MYRKGYSICLGFICLAAASCVAYAAALVWENNKKEKTLREREVALTDEEKKYLGVSSRFLCRQVTPADSLLPQDLNPEFRYML